MIGSEEKYWLSITYPDLVPSEHSVAGTIQFVATYNEKTNLFVICRENAVDDVGGVKLLCSYQIEITEPRPGDYSVLPILRVRDIELVSNRHFRQDGTACLCSPLEEKDFIDPAFDFRKFLEELVIPYLYGQSFYTTYGRWPWSEYAHYSVGLLESFQDQNPTALSDVEEFLALLTIDRTMWPEIRAVLLRNEIKGHTACFCAKHDQLRRCHPKALKGLRQLHQRIRALSVTLPPLATPNPTR